MSLSKIANRKPDDATLEQPDGVILAGGTGTRLFPVTVGVNKHLLPVFDKPMIYYPLTTLILSGVRRVWIVSTPTGTVEIERLLGDGSAIGLEIRYLQQPQPLGVADALRTASEATVAPRLIVVLGDNLFHGAGLGRSLASALVQRSAVAMTTEVADISHFGELQVGSRGEPVNIVEKPQRSGGGLALLGLYGFRRDALDGLAAMEASSRGELEITDVLLRCLRSDQFDVVELPRGTYWGDMGEPESLMSASRYVEAIQGRTGLPVGSIHEAAFRVGLVSLASFIQMVESMPDSRYRRLLQGLGAARASPKSIR